MALFSVFTSTHLHLKTCIEDFAAPCWSEIKECLIRQHVSRVGYQSGQVQQWVDMRQAGIFSMDKQLTV